MIRLVERGPKFPIRTREDDLCQRCGHPRRSHFENGSRCVHPVHVWKDGESHYRRCPCSTFLDLSAEKSPETVQQRFADASHRQDHDTHRLNPTLQLAFDRGYPWETRHRTCMVPRISKPPSRRTIFFSDRLPPRDRTRVRRSFQVSAIRKVCARYSHHILSGLR
jgi:hypothetical protein